MVDGRVEGTVATFPVGLMSTDWRSVDGVSQFYQGNENFLLFFYSVCAAVCLAALTLHL
jgi:hypothetical protein